MTDAQRRRKLEYQRQWGAQKIARWRATGCCVRCGTPAGVNPHTGRAFWHCFRHRLEATKACAPHRRRRAERIKAAREGRAA